MLLIHLLLSSVSVEGVECTSCHSFLRLFRNYVYYHFIFPRVDRRGVGIRAGGLENFQKLISGGGAIIRYSRVAKEHLMSYNYLYFRSCAPC